MSVNSNPGTCSQEVGSKISETTIGEDKGQNRFVIEWLSRADPGSPYLTTGEGEWSYREVIDEVQMRLRPDPVVLRPGRDAESVFDIIAGMAGGGAIVEAPGVEAPDGSDPAGAALVVYTSGTTGGPKAVRLTRSNLEAASRSSVAHLGHGPGDTWLGAMPLHHVGGISILVRSAYAGGTVELHWRFDPDRFAGALKGRATMASMVPTMLRRLLDEDPGPYEGSRAVLIGGGPIPEGLLERAAAAGLPVLPSYGMTETFGQVATLRPGMPLGHRAHPLPGIDIRIGAEGRIELRGDQVSPGYLGEPDRPSPWLTTGDLGEIDEDGALRILGRADRVIVTGGENVDPEQVERRIAEHPGVEEAVVVGLPDEEWGEVLACLFTGSALPDELRSWLADRLPGHMVPKHWRAVGGVPRTPLGKPDRQAAAAAFET